MSKKIKRKPPKDKYDIQVHVLKAAHPYFSAILNGRKSFELRKDDRGFEVNDLLVLRELVSHRATLRRIRYILRFSELPSEWFGPLPKDVVILGLEDAKVGPYPSE